MVDGEALGPLGVTVGNVVGDTVGFDDGPDGVADGIVDGVADGDWLGTVDVVEVGRIDGIDEGT